MANQYKILGGDFNVVMDNNKDLWGLVQGVHAHSNSMEFLKQHIINEELIDVWRQGHQDAHQFTYICNNPTYFARLYCFCGVQDTGTIYPEFRDKTRFCI